MIDDYTPGEQGAHAGKCEHCSRWTYVVHVRIMTGIPKLQEWLMTDQRIPDLWTAEVLLCKRCVKLCTTRGCHTGTSIGTKKKEE